MIIPSSWADNQSDRKCNVDISVNTKELDEALEKAERLVKLLERAHELSIAVLLNSAT